MVARPRRARRGDGLRVLAVLVVTLALAAPVSSTSGSAEELHERKHRVERRIDAGKRDLHHSSTRLAAAVRRLERAVAELRRAQDSLATARDDVAQAQARDLSMQAALEEAVAQEARARAALGDGHAAVAEREHELRSIAAQMQASGGSDLMALSTVIRSKELAQVTGGLSTRQSILDREAAAMARLDASVVVLSVREAALREATAEAGRRREAAAESLQVTTQLEARAQVAQDRVRQLVAQRRKARQQAAAARAEDRSRLRQLRKERDRISRQLRHRAARERAAHRSSRQAMRAPGVLAHPVRGPVTSSYGMRFHPVYHRWALHDGTDFGAGCGTPVRVARSGTVVGSYYAIGYGNRVVVDHGWVRGAGLGTSYNHLSRSSAHVGERVRRGEVVGYVGSTGYSTGCHLHFMVFRNGTTVNPGGWL